MITELAFLQNQYCALEKQQIGNNLPTKMKKFFCVLIASISFSGPLFSKTVEERTLASLVQAIGLYDSQKNDTPSDWISMEQFGFERTLKDARDVLDVENRYFFPKLEQAFVSRHQSRRRIILMAKNSGEEGDIREYESSTSYKSSRGRFVIFKNIESGKIESGKIPEKELFTMFQKEGLHLHDFTFDMPRRPSLRTDSRSRIESQDLPVETNLSPEGNESNLRQKSVKLEKLETSPQHDSWVRRWLLIVFLLLLSLIVCLALRKFRAK